MLSLDTWHYVITGYLQNRGTQSRFVTMWQDLRATHTDNSTQVELKPWNSNWDHEAEFAFRLSAHSHPRICLYAYSWGAGWGAMQFARKLRDRGIKVDTMVLADAVYRHPYALGQWRLFLPYLKIMVPDNVREVFWYRQRETFPRGHDVCAHDQEFTTIHDPVVLTATHANMDDQDEIIQKCLEVAGRSQ